MQPRKPIYSTYEQNEDARAAISDFVIRLAEGVDGLQDLHSAGDFAALARECGRYAEQAVAFGYPLFAELAAQVAVAAADEKAERAEESLRELADVAYRIRLAHRGAA